MILLGTAYAGEYETLRQRILENFEDGRLDAARNLLERAQPYEGEFDAQLRLVATHVYRTRCELARALEQASKASMRARMDDDADMQNTAQLMEREIRGSFGRLRLTVEFVGDDWEDLPNGQAPVAVDAPEVDEESRACVDQARVALEKLSAGWVAAESPVAVAPADRSLEVWLPIGQYAFDGVNVSVEPVTQDAATANVTVRRAPPALAAEAVPTKPGGKEGSGRIWLWTAVGVAVVGAAVGGGYLLLQDDPAAEESDVVNVRLRTHGQGTR